jgi:hypothetical protein
MRRRKRRRMKRRSRKRRSKRRRRRRRRRYRELSITISLLNIPLHIWKILFSNFYPDI